MVLRPPENRLEITILIEYSELSIARPHPTKAATIDVPHILVQEAVKKALKEPDKISVLFCDEINRGEDSRVTNSKCILH